MRTNTADVDGLLRQALAAHLVDDPAAPANYSLQLLAPAAAGAATRPLHRLFEGPRELVVDRCPSRVVRALVTALGGFCPPDGAHLQLWATALAGPAGAVLAPVEWRRRLPALRRALRRTGWTVLDVPFVSLDLDTGYLVVPEPPLAVDVAALTGLGGSGGPPAPDPAGPRPLRGWVLPPTGSDRPLRRTDAVVAGMRLCRNRGDVGGRRALALLAEQVRSLPVTRAPRTFADGDVADLLADLLAR